MSDGPGPALLNRLLAERAEAHRRYNEALTLVDRAIQSAPELPPPPAAYDETLLPRINDTWEILPKGAPKRPEEWARLFDKQMTFNAAVVTDASGKITALTSFGQTIFSGPVTRIATTWSRL